MLTHYYAGTAISGAIPLSEEEGFSARAEIGNVEQINVVVDDPTGTLDFVGYKSWKMVEDDCPAGSQVAWYGLVSDQEIGRGISMVFPVGTGRQWHLTLLEANRYASMRVFTDAGANRPAETVSARVTWLLTETGWTGVISDYGLVASSSIDMDPVDYRGRTGADVLRDCSLYSGFNWFIRYREATSDLELAFYNADIAAIDVSTFRVSNDPADVDEAITWSVGFKEPKLIRGAQRIASGIWLPYSGGTYYDTLPSTGSAFADVDLVAPTSSVTTPAAAAALTTRLLTQHSEQDERVTGVRVRIDSDHLNDIRQGQLMQARFVHFPGWTTMRYCRALLKTFSRPPNQDQDHYDVDLELTPAEPAELVATFAQLQGENRNGTGPETYNLIWNNSGDNPDAQHDPNPLVGLVEYYLPVSSGGTGFTMLGAGTVTVTLQADVALVATGDYTGVFHVYKNGVSALSQSHTSSGGLRFESWATSPLTGSIVVANGDVLTVHYVDNAPYSTDTFPAGVDATDFTVSGSLTA